MSSVDAPSSALEKTIDLRHQRLEQAVALMSGVWTGEIAGGRDFVSRVLVTLLENRAFVQSHATALVDRIVRECAADDQDAAIDQEVRPSWDLVSRAEVAIARSRAVLSHLDREL